MLNKRQTVIFAIIFVYLCSIGTAYAFVGKVDEPKEHVPQREIKREFKKLPSEAFYEAPELQKSNSES
ncbi:hypothetical protein [Metabacillus malikii]|uniref:Uncharacterized protein n=1 Tax=Metabacillus malikii TaxID=1504265 RepID=A0ABT9ZHF1_9BACI|nr:hypothetical protein [Metabacillus malikii]MDQ0231405.1 hypothetical protein [Metabacillus malikii]